MIVIAQSIYDLWKDDYYCYCLLACTTVNLFDDESWGEENNKFRDETSSQRKSQMSQITEEKFLIWSRPMRRHSEIENCIRICIIRAEPLQPLTYSLRCWWQKQLQISMHESQTHDVQPIKENNFKISSQSATFPLEMIPKPRKKKIIKCNLFFVEVEEIKTVEVEGRKIE